MIKLIALLITLAKGSIALEKFLANLTEAYTTWKLEENNRDEQDKNARDDQLIADAIGRLPKCPTCGLPDIRRGQHQSPVGAPSVPGSGGSGS